MRQIYLLLFVLFFSSEISAQEYKLIIGDNTQSVYSHHNIIDKNSSLYCLLGNYYYDPNISGFPIEGTGLKSFQLIKINSKGDFNVDTNKVDIINGMPYPHSNFVLRNNQVYFSYCEQRYGPITPDSNIIASGFIELLVELDTNGNFISKLPITKFKIGQPLQTDLQLIDKNLIITTSTSKKIEITKYAIDNGSITGFILNKQMPEFNVDRSNNTFNISGFEGNTGLKFSYFKLDTNFEVLSEKTIPNIAYNIRGTTLLSFRDNSYGIYGRNKLFNYDQNFKLIWHLVLDPDLEIKSIKEVQNGSKILTCQRFGEFNTDIFKLIISKDGKLLSKEKLFSGIDMMLSNVYYGKDYYISIIDTAINFMQKGVAPKVLIRKTAFKSKEIKKSDKALDIYYENKNIYISNLLNSEIGLITLYDSAGKMCYKTKTEEQVFNFSTDDLRNGIYLIKIGNYSQKILIK